MKTYDYNPTYVDNAVLVHRKDYEDLIALHDRIYEKIKELSVFVRCLPEGTGEEYRHFLRALTWAVQPEKPWSPT